MPFFGPLIWQVLNTSKASKQASKLLGRSALPSSSEEVLLCMQSDHEVGSIRMEVKAPLQRARRGGGDGRA